MDLKRMGPVFYFLLIVCHADSMKNVLRENYGVNFRHTGQMDMREELWRVTINIDLPKLPKPGIADCNLQTKECQQALRIYRYQMEAWHKTKSIVEEIPLLVPSMDELSESLMEKKRKSLLTSIVGTVSESLPGISTFNDEDVQVLREHTNRMTEVVGNVGIQMEGFTSIMVATNEKIMSALRQIQQNHNTTERLIRGINYKLEQWIDVLITNIERLHNYQIVMEQLDEVHLGIQNLARGRLSPNLLSPEQLSHLLSDVSAKLLSKYYYDFHITQTDPNFYYQFGEAVGVRKGSSISILIKIPIASRYDSKFNVYSVETFYVPTDETVTHSTKLEVTTKYFVYRYQPFGDSEYIELDTDPLIQCPEASELRCPAILPVREEMYNPSCLSSLYRNIPSLVLEMCNFRYFPKAPPKLVSEVTPGEIIVSSIEKISMYCAEDDWKWSHYNGCSYCLFRLPCGCRISADYFHIPSQDIRCTPSKQMTKRFPVNLAVLQHFLNAGVWQGINGSSSFKTLKKFTLPNVTIFNNEYNDLVSTAHDVHFDLRHLARKAKLNGTIFASTADVRADILRSNARPDYSFILSLVSLGTSLFCLIILLIHILRQGCTRKCKTQRVIHKMALGTLVTSVGKGLDIINV